MDGGRITGPAGVSTVTGGVLTGSPLGGEVATPPVKPGLTEVTAGPAAGGVVPGAVAHGHHVRTRSAELSVNYPRLLRVCVSLCLDDSGLPAAEAPGAAPGAAGGTGNPKISCTNKMIKLVRFANQRKSMIELHMFTVVGRAFRSGRSLSTEEKSMLKFSRGPVGHRGSARDTKSLITFCS